MSKNYKWEWWDYFLAIILLSAGSVLAMIYGLALAFFSWQEVAVAHLAVGLAAYLAAKLSQSAWPTIRDYYGLKRYTPSPEETE